MQLKEKKTEFKKLSIIFAVAVVGRLLLFLITYKLASNMGMSKSLYDQLAGAGDVEHYIYLAQHWYQSTGEKANLIVFFPLMPMLMAVFRVIFRDYLIAGLFISYASFGIGTCYFYKLLKLDFDDEKTAGGLLALFMGVFGIFFNSAHTESLFVMLTAMCLYYMRKRSFVAAGIIGFFAALSKTQGMLLFVPVVYEIVIICIKEKKFNPRMLASLLIPMGYILYLCLNKAVAGSFTKFIEYQAAEPWYNTSTWIANSLSTSYNTGHGNQHLAMIIYWPQITAFFIAVAAIFAGLKKKVNVSYLLFIGAYTGATYLQSWMISGGRYMTMCLPLYIVFAAVDNKYIKNIILIAEGLLFVLIGALWIKGYAIM